MEAVVNRGAKGMGGLDDATNALAGLFELFTLLATMLLTTLLLLLLLIMVSGTPLGKG